MKKPDKEQRLRALMKLYHGSVYEARVRGRRVSLRAGRRCPALVALQKACGARTALYITAWNPRGLSRPRAANQAANRRLKAELLRLTSHVWGGRGHSEDDSWSEDSFLALGISLEDSRKLGRKYRQVAMVWVGRTGIPRIVKTAPLLQG